MSTELGGCFQKSPSKFKAGEAFLCANKQCSSEKGLKQWCFIPQASPFGGSNILAGSHGFWWVSLLFFSQVVPCSWDTSTSTVTMITQNYKAIYNALQFLCWPLGSESIPKHQKSEWVALATIQALGPLGYIPSILLNFNGIYFEGLVSLLGLLRLLFLKQEHKLSHKVYFWYNLSLQWATLSYRYYFSCIKQRRFVKIGMVFPICLLTFSSLLCSDSTSKHFILPLR